VFHIIFFIVSLVLLGSGVSSSQVGSGGYQYNVVVTIATIVISLAAIGISIALIGIQGLASGLNDTSTFSIQRLVVFGAIWAILSGVTFQIFNLLSVLGIVIYTILSIFFAIYVFVGGSDN
jgi:hypothetical protein